MIIRLFFVYGLSSNSVLVFICYDPALAGLISTTDLLALFFCTAGYVICITYG